MKTKTLIGISAAIVIAGSVGLVLQQQTIAELRESELRIQRQVSELAAANAANVKALSETEKELTRLRFDSVTAKAAGASEARFRVGRPARPPEEERRSPGWTRRRARKRRSKSADATNRFSNSAA